NKKVLSVLHTISNEYAKLGIPFLLLKGPSNGSNYPDYFLRTPGDLDLLLYRQGDYEKARDWIARQGIPIVESSGIHSKFYMDGVSIENHHRITYFNHKKYDRRFQAIEESLSCKEYLYNIS